jgi:hypothetical protein
MAGDQDASYGSGGSIVVDPDGTETVRPSFLVRPDGSGIVAEISNDSKKCGVNVSRFDSHGQIDQNFGDGGKVFTPLTPNPLKGTTLDDGSIVVLSLNLTIVDGKEVAPSMTVMRFAPP